MSSADIKAGAAYVEVYVNNSRLMRGLKAAQRRLRAFSASVGAMGKRMTMVSGVLAAPLIASVKAFANMGDAMGKMASRTGVSVEALSELSFAAQQSGSDIGSLENGLRRMQRSIYDAGRGSATAVDALKDLGLTFNDLDGMSPEAQFKLLADRISKVDDPTRKAAIAMSLFGRAGTGLLPMFAQGAAGIQALQDEAKSLGLTMSTKDAKAAEAFTDALSRLWNVVKIGTFHVGASLAPTLQSLVAKITGVIKHVNDWVKANRGIIVSVAKVLAVTALIGGGLISLGATASVIAFAFGGLVSIITGMVIAIKAAAAVVAAILSPIGLLIAAVAAVGTAILLYTGAGGKALAWLGAKFTALKNFACQAWQGIGAALAKGDIALAGKILWLSLKMVFQKGVNALMKLWIDFKTSALSVWVNLKASVQKLWQELWFALKEVAIKTGLAEPILKTFHALESGWLKLTQFFSRLWLKMCSGVMKAWNRVSKGIKGVQGWLSEKVVGVMAFFDESLDEEAMKKQVREKFAGKQKKLDDELKDLDQKQATQEKKLAKDQADQQKKLDEKQKGRLDELDRQKAIGNKGRREEKEEAKKAIDAAKARELEALETQAQTDLDTSANELQQARAEWKAAIGEATKGGKKESAEKGNDYNLSSEGVFEETKQKLQAASPKLNAASNSIGTFSAQFAGRMIAGSAAERTAEFVEKLYEEQRRANKKAEKQGQTFTFSGANSPM